MEGKAKRHDMGVVFPELQRRCILGKRIQTHLKKVQGKLTVEVV
jgi:hypothetical protein